MKKHINLLILFSFLFMWMLSIIGINIILKNRYNENIKKQMNEYLILSGNIFNSNNYLETYELLNDLNNQVKIQFLNYDGELKFSNAEFEYLLNSDDILTQMEIFKVKLDKNSYFLASTNDDGHFIRIVLPENNPKTYQYILISGAILSLLFLLIRLILEKHIDKKCDIISRNINNIYHILNEENEFSQSFEEIEGSLIQLGSILISKKNEINNQRDKSDVIINNINRGIVVISKNKDILLVNKYAAELFKTTIYNLNKNYIYMFRNTKIQESIEEAISNNTYVSREVKINAKYYHYNIHNLNYKWDESENTYVLLISEISDTRNTEIMKREFFANASHELKSPLTTIIGYQQMINEELITSKEDILDASSRTLKEAKRMNKILSEMLELSKLESRNEVNKEKINLSNLVSEIIETKKEDIKKRGLDTVLNLSEYSILMNSSHAYQMINNLIDNAIKYNKENGKVIITIDKEKNHLSVEDTGVGIKEEDLDRIYERFYRVDKARSKDVGGTGLGLAIVKHVCSVYDFTISTNSIYNQGTKITINFR